MNLLIQGAHEQKKKWIAVRKRLFSSHSKEKVNTVFL